MLGFCQAVTVVVICTLLESVICQDSGDLRSSVTRKPIPANSKPKAAVPPVKPEETPDEEDEPAAQELNPEGLPEECGNSDAIHSRIVGGKSAKIGAWPWIAAIGYKYDTVVETVEYYCGGALISDTFVVTAAHCVYETDNVFSVRLGEHNLESDDDGVTPLDVEIAEVITHPEYDPESQLNDIALLRLKESVPFESKISPVCLPSTEALKSELFEGQRPFVAGWGVTQFRGYPSAVLQEVQVPVVPVPECIERYKVGVDSLIDDSHICAGLMHGGKDACQGDSGGPLMQSVGDKYVLIGVVSFGFKCAEPGYPGVYTRVTSKLEWINATIHS